MTRRHRIVLLAAGILVLGLTSPGLAGDGVEKQSQVFADAGPLATELAACCNDAAISRTSPEGLTIKDSPGQRGPGPAGNSPANLLGDGVEASLRGRRDAGMTPPGGRHRACRSVGG